MHSEHTKHEFRRQVTLTQGISVRTKIGNPELPGMHMYIFILDIKLKEEIKTALGVAIKPLNTGRLIFHSLRFCTLQLKSKHKLFFNFL